MQVPALQLTDKLLIVAAQFTRSNYLPTIPIAGK
jgi:hypothetical protein